jgi:hypothetical protein
MQKRNFLKVFFFLFISDKIFKDIKTLKNATNIKIVRFKNNIWHLEKND